MPPAQPCVAAGIDTPITLVSASAEPETSVAAIAADNSVVLITCIFSKGLAKRLLNI